MAIITNADYTISGGGGSTTYKGSWDANTNIPLLVNGVGNNGEYYNVTVAGIVDFGAGNISFEVNDHVAYSGSIWYKLDNSWVASEILTDGTFTPNTSQNAAANVSVKENLERLAGTKQTAIIANDNLQKGFFKIDELNTPSTVLKTIQLQNNFHGGSIATNSSNYGTSPVISMVDGSYVPRKIIAQYTTIELNTILATWTSAGLENDLINSVAYNKTLGVHVLCDGLSWVPIIEDSINDTVTNRSPSQNAVFDALSLKKDLTEPITAINTGTIYNIPIDSVRKYFISGTVTNVRFPVANTTLPLNTIYEIANQGINTINIENSAGSLQGQLSRGQSARFILRSKATAPGSWDMINKANVHGAFTANAFLQTNSIGELTSGSASASQITNTPSGNISANNVQTAINELDTEKANDYLVTQQLVTGNGFSGINTATRRVIITGTSSQTLGLPNAIFGHTIEIINNATGSGIISINNAGGGFIGITLSAGQRTTIVCTDGSNSSGTWSNFGVQPLKYEGGLFLNSGTVTRSIGYGYTGGGSPTNITTTAVVDLIGGTIQFAGGDINPFSSSILQFSISTAGVYQCRWMFEFQSSQVGGFLAPTIFCTGSFTRLGADTYPYVYIAQTSQYTPFYYEETIILYPGSTVRPRFSQWNNNSSSIRWNRFTIERIG